MCRERLDALPSDATELSFGNNVYKIRFDERDNRPLYGFRYHFYLKDAVEDVPEYLVNWDNFVKYAPLCILSNSVTYKRLFRMAAEYDLDLIYEKEFHEVYAENEDHAEYGPMLQHMKVVDANGESQMDEDQWEAASTFSITVPVMITLTCCIDIYIAFAFQKRSRSSS
jgi:mRNA (guanine-N7-)-methyltransferase